MHIFVYGTLKRGFGNHRLLEDSTFVGKATVTGNFKMISLEAFPMVLEDDEERTIHGELYEIDEKILASLDMLEGYPYLYDRKFVSSVDGGGNQFEAYMYIGHSDGVFTSDSPTIEEGIWEATK